MDKFTVITESGVLIEHIEAEYWELREEHYYFFKEKKHILSTPISSTVINETQLGQGIISKKTTTNGR